MTNPDFVFSEIDDFEEYCVSGYYSNEYMSSATDECDFTPLLQKYKEPCEAQGGILYKYTDKYNHSEGYYNDAPYQAIYKNVPVCIGVSCHAKNYFEEVVFPTLSFLYEGDFYELDYYYLYYMRVPNITYHYTTTHEPIESSPVLDTENPYSKFLLKVQEIDGEEVDSTKMCKWLTKTTEEKREKICTNKRYQVYSEKSEAGPASLVCLETCAPYCHDEKASAKFVYAYDDVNGLVTKQCKWLEKADPDVIDSVCKTIVEVGEETVYGQAAETCTKTCGSC